MMKVVLLVFKKEKKKEKRKKLVLLDLLLEVLSSMSLSFFLSIKRWEYRGETSNIVNINV